MTFDYEASNANKLVKSLEAVAKKYEHLEIYQRNSPENKRARNQKYVELIEPVIRGCEHKWILQFTEVAEKKEEILCHVADIMYRSATDIASEGDLTIDDVLVLSVAAFLRRKNDKHLNTSLFTHIEDFGIPRNDLNSIAERFVNYQMQNLPGEYEQDDPGKLAAVLGYQFSFGQTMKEYAGSIGVNPRVAHDRIAALRLFEKENLLAILYSAGHVDLSIEHGSLAYNSTFTSLSRGKPFAPKPLT